MLADLNVQELPLNVLEAMQQAIAAEIRYRETYGAVRWPVLDSRVPMAVHWTGIPGQGAFSLPARIRREPLQARVLYLGVLLAQDWDACFPGADAQRQEFYVYAHVDPREKPIILTSEVRLRGQPFYIGKGTGQRAWDLKRNQGHGKRIKSIREGGFAESAIVDIIATDLTERQALSLEAKLIYFFGSIYDEATQGCLLNLADQAKPAFTKEMQRVQRPARISPVASTRKGRTRHYNSRWEQWQETKLNRRHVSAAEREMGYTIAIVPPIGRTVFLDVMKLIAEYQQAQSAQEPQPEVTELWYLWEQWTARVASYCERRHYQEPAPVPPFPL